MNNSEHKENENKEPNTLNDLKGKSISWSNRNTTRGGGGEVSILYKF